MRDCPKCGAVVDGQWCKACGEGRPTEEKAKTHDPNWWRCCDTDVQGNRCAAPGMLTESLRGSDRWYCHQHYPPFSRRTYANAIPPPDWVKRLPSGPKPVDFEAEAERLALQQV